MTFEDKLINNNLEDAVYLVNPSYEDAVIGYTDDGCIVYDYDLMVECLVKDGMQTTDAIEWIDYNVIRAIPYYGDKAPIIMHNFIE